MLSASLGSEVTDVKARPFLAGLGPLVHHCRTTGQKNLWAQMLTDTCLQDTHAIVSCVQSDFVCMVAHIRTHTEELCGYELSLSTSVWGIREKNLVINGVHLKRQINISRCQIKLNI